MLAGGFVLSALAQVKLMRSGATRLEGVLGEIEPSPVQPRAHALPKVKLPTVTSKPKLAQYDVKSIDTRVGLIGELVRKGSLNPELREKTVEILAQKCDKLGQVSVNGDRWCVAEKDCLGEVRALFDVVKNPKSKYAVRYTRDALLADVFTAPERTLFKTHAGDCDDSACLLGAMLMAVGHPVRLRVIATRRPGVPDSQVSWSHIYLLTPTAFDDPNAPWIAVDASMNKPLGWEAPGAKEVAATGKPAGIVARVKDFTLVKPGDAA